jgi:GST-like protein
MPAMSRSRAERASAAWAAALEGVCSIKGEAFEAAASFQPGPAMPKPGAGGKQAQARSPQRDLHGPSCRAATLPGFQARPISDDRGRIQRFLHHLRGLLMTDLSAFPITQRWPAQHPDRIQLFSLPTPNGVKVSIALEELGLAYEPHLIDIGQNETWTPEFLSLNPNGKIPAIIDPDGPGGKPLALFESGAILVYLAEKTGKLMPADPALRYETLQWVFFQMAAVGPMFGQLGFFHRFAGKEYEDKRPRDRYAAESKRLLGVLETRLAGRDWIMGGDYSIADIALLGWVRNLIGFYDAGALVDYASLKNVPAWLERGLARPAVQRGLDSPKRG